MRRKSLVIFLLCLFWCAAQAQIPSIQWQKCLGGSNNEADVFQNVASYKVIQTNDKGFLVLGVTSSSDGDVSGNNGLQDIWVVKLNSKGNIQWDRNFGGSFNDISGDIKQTRDGGYIVCGTFGAYNGAIGGHGGYDVLVIKLSADGTTQWQKYYGGTGADYGNSIVESDNGGFVFCGRTESNDGNVSGNHGGGDLWIGKIDSLGSLLWQKCFGGGYSEWGTSINKTADGNYIVGGFQAQTGSNVTTTANFDSYVLKIDPNGSQLWQKKFGGSYYEDIHQIKQTSDGGYIFAGTAKSNDGDVTGGHPDALQPGSYSFDSWIVKLNSLGNLVWQKSMGGSFDDIGYDVVEVSDGYYALSEALSNDGDVSGNHGQTDSWVVKLDFNGNIVSQKCYGGSLADNPGSLQIIGDNELIFTGETGSSNGDVNNKHGGSDIWLVKLSNKPNEYNSIVGNVYIDKNANGQQDNDEVAYDNKQVFIKDNSGYQSFYRNDAPGHFNIKVDTGHFEVSLSYTNTGYRPVPKTAAANFSDYSNSKAISFGMVPDSLVSNAIASVDSFSKLRPGQPADFNVYYRFDGASKNINGVLTLIKDSRLLYDSSEVLPYSISGDTIIFKVNSSNNNQPVNFLLHLKVANTPAANAGDNVMIRYNLQPVTVDSAYFEEWDTLKQVILPPINTVTGNVYIDYNGNNVFDWDEPYFSGGLMEIEKQGTIVGKYTDQGQFSLEIDTGAYNISFKPNKPYYVVSPTSINPTFSTYYNSDSVDFAVRPIPGNKDLDISAFPINRAKPGFGNPYQITYTNSGTDTIKGVTVVFVKDHRVSYYTATTIPSRVSNDSLIWNISELDPQDASGIIIYLVNGSSPQVNQGDTLKFSAAITPVAGDITPGDNNVDIKQVVVSSFDPNDKNEVHGGSMPQSKITNGEFLTYIIRFQNTGNATAANVIIRDTLEPKLDWSTFEMIYADHFYDLSITNGNRLEWTFSNINLVDSSANATASQGAIIYRIKAKTDLLTTDTIRNTAGIYFDYNPPVQTIASRTAIIGAIALPVYLLNWNAILNTDQVDLSWQTSYEANTAYFEIERGEDGTKFVAIGKISAKNSLSGASYAFSDPGFNKGVNYYRLKIVDLDGLYKYSNILVIKTANESGVRISVYPNPANEVISVNLEGILKGNAIIKAIDLSGKVLLTRVIGNLDASSYSTQVNLSSLAAGVYIIQVQVGNKVQRYKLIVR